MIELTDISLRIDGKRILNNINLTINEGKCFGLVGRNGSGKTMLMKVLCGFVLPTTGTVTIGNERIGETCDFPSDTGVIIETPGFIQSKSGFKNLKNLAALNGIIGDETVRETMKMVGLDPGSDIPISKYSMGMKQRLGLAQAVMENPKLLVLDEPFNGLDMEGVEDMRGYLLRQKKEGRTIVISSHHKEDIDVLCDDYVVMNHGEIIERVSNEEYQ